MKTKMYLAAAHVGLMLMGIAPALDENCTKPGKCTEAWIPFSYYTQADIPLPEKGTPNFSREPLPGRPDEQCEGIEVERIVPGQDGYRYFHCYRYTISDDGTRLYGNVSSVRAPQDDGEFAWNGNRRSSSFSYTTTEPGVFIIDGETLRFEQYPGGGIRALHLGCPDGAGNIADEQTVYEAPTDLGRVVFIGDSITHGVGAPSYRWALHKILTDNGVKYEEMGVEQGNRLPEYGVKPGTSYRGVPFRNLHCAMTSERAYEISGRKHPSQRLDATDLLDWLGLDAAYKGARRLPAAPDTAFILIGTNDMLGDYDGSFEKPENAALLQKALLDDEQGDMSRIVAALRRANPQVRVVVLSVPTWEYSELNQKPESFSALAEYNRALQAWAARKGVIFADVNRVLTDATETQMPGRGARGLYYEEEGLHLHPSPQGDLLVAGAVAQALGIPGRTVGWFAPKGKINSFSLKENEETYLTHDARRALALKFSLDSAEAETRDRLQGGVNISLGDGVHSGRLTVSRYGITWGDGTLLYPAELSERVVCIRMAWMPGDAANGVAEGYYVWLGRMLIGEALPSDSAAMSGIRIQNAQKLYKSRLNTRFNLLGEE